MRLSISLALAIFVSACGQSASAASDAVPGMAPGTIVVARAMWNGQDVTEQVRNLCEGKMNCHFDVDSDSLGRLEGSDGSGFVVKWACKDRSGSATRIGAATSTPVKLECPGSKSNMAAPDWTPLSPLKYPSSLHSFLLSAERSAVEDAITDSCLAAVREHLKQRKNFSSPVIRRFIAPIASMENDETTDLQFFHYTDASGMKTVVTERKYEEIFKFLRGKYKDSERWYLYIASDSRSSRRFGDIQVRVFLKPTTQVLFINDDGPRGQNLRAGAVKNAIEEDLMTRFPRLKNCSDNGYSQDRFQAHSILMMLAAEAEGVGVIAYYGVENHKCPYDNCAKDRSQWFQLLSSWAIQQLQIGK